MWLTLYSNSQYLIIYHDYRFRTLFHLCPRLNWFHLALLLLQYKYHNSHRLAISFNEMDSLYFYQKWLQALTFQVQNQIEIIIYFLQQIRLMNKVVEDYVLMESIGKGQYGNVYRAENRKNNKLFAVKVMSAQKFKNTPRLSEFTNNQINILTKISHPNIIQFIEMLRTPNNYYLVYQYCNGGTLGDYIKTKRRLPEDQALKIFGQLRSGFEILHKEKVLHRDLKPTNILFHNGIIKIADFGFCKEMMKDQMAQTMLGSPIYMAPEVLKGSIYDNRADIWSLGVILYQMLFGFCPYEQSSITKLINLIDNTLLKFPSQISISNHVKILLKRMMTIKYRERITPAQFLKYPLEIKENQQSLSRSRKSINITIKDAMSFCRKMMAYLGQTLEILTENLDEEVYVLLSFIVFKILSTIQNDTFTQSVYWANIKAPNNDEKWDIILQGEVKALQPFGTMIRNGILNGSPTLKAKNQLDTNYIDDFKYFIDLIQEVKNKDLKERLINCFLIERHFMLALEKKILDFTNYIESPKTFNQKQDICKKFAYMRS